MSDGLSLQRTKFSNQRTYLSYMRTGFSIAAVAGTFKKKWIALFGFLMIIGSTIQYIAFNRMIQNQTNLNQPIFDYIPVIYVILSLGTLYLQLYK